jgi:hypothetical protein
MDQTPELAKQPVEKRHKKTFFPIQEEGVCMSFERYSAVVMVLHYLPFLVSPDQT